MKATDMPYETKQKILSQIEAQIGSTDYYKMVGRLGENGLIDFALEKAEEAAQKQRGFWAKYGWGIAFWTIVAIVVCWVAGVGNVLAYILIVFVTPWVIQLIGSLLSEMWKSINIKLPYR